MRLVVLLFALTVATSLHAQDPAAALQSLQGRELPIRDFLAAPVLSYHWAAGHLQHDPLNTFTLGMLRIDSVKIKQSHGVVQYVEIRGLRRTESKVFPGMLTPPAEPDPVMLRVDLTGAPPATAADLVNQLFYTDLPAAIAALPERWQQASPDNSRHGGGRFVYRAGQWMPLPQSSRPSPPRVTKSVQAEFSEQARRMKVSGDVMVAIAMDDTGVPIEVWLLRPLGLGLDEEALKASLKYRFNPALLDGEAVGTIINMSVNFQIF